MTKSEFRLRSDSWAPALCTTSAEGVKHSWQEAEAGVRNDVAVEAYSWGVCVMGSVRFGKSDRSWCCWRQGSVGRQADSFTYDIAQWPVPRLPETPIELTVIYWARNVCQAWPKGFDNHDLLQCTSWLHGYSDSLFAVERQSFCLVWNSMQRKVVLCRLEGLVSHVVNTGPQLQWIYFNFFPCLGFCQLTMKDFRGVLVFGWFFSQD